MAKIKTQYRCNACSWETAKWLGQCRECGQWGTMEEFTVAPKAAVASPIDLAPSKGAPQAVSIRSVRVEDADPFPSDIKEFDRVLGGGIVPGSVVLLAGEPGVGKSTLLLEVAARYAVQARWKDLSPVLYVTGEESVAQVSRRAQRVGALESKLLIATENHMSGVEELVRTEKPSLFVVDSVQTMTSDLVDGVPGSVGQVKAVTSQIVSLAKQLGIPAVIVGHVTKDGNIAGPKTLEHLVDVVCQFEGDATGRLRLLRSLKNRYGSTDEVGCFTLEEDGVHEVPDPSSLFTSETHGQAPGSVLTVTVDGVRPLVTEVQALTALGTGGTPRRATSGVDSSRVAMLLAVLQSRFNVNLTRDDVYVSTVGGARVREPAADLAIALAVASSYNDLPPVEPVVALGEVGLTGEIRGCSWLPGRVREAARLGFKTILVPAAQVSELKPMADVAVVPVGTLGEAVVWAFP